ncbi:MAG: alanine--tRNA ligase [Ignavibacteria bacterium RIFOXYB2_FULL_35_12]|nr:MAG: alanine--tRNA ligase [Ignavibacteria bacterium GWA2_36_19]OGU62583.1 MAG: alanine--tRNA ligase [Ignavibacteria bacterium GWF2_35_20]OGU79397.1 MAG: alanine--tRNA ligase [Ignavibacteria bacterium RIFOXYA2_FULL_35_9]OGU89624.1 MAG: alanine--tRNA ligase [Ignavibacteria bacterium RIFOXYA12_FULL_35_25]OGU94680.1 MAG: alanine--tRNA ligase [Ignavibacteria bacterium RIFOXYB12_FULL_35_14]OGV01667.1 MAG: alanine--tRNA ligase [Ignavibacteria bacterium RIFOXYC2_FULL_35_16]OGV03970.1 MAG: alanine-
MTSKEIRQQFLDFFKSKEHKIVSSAPVVPFDDPTLLFANAGMNQFKDVFLAEGTREYKRAVNTQKCIRVSGKHNDLEEVGHDTYHHTFFEMLGNWSFGDPNSSDGIGTGYYKAEAIEWAWELLTEVWKFPKERIWATVYRTDDEAFHFWKTKTDINPKHILRFDEKDNFWEMGETGPCGPCSEIHINVGDDYDNPKYVNAGVPECIEIWNLVFIQYNRDEKGKLHELPAKHVDTGMGFERVCAILQKKSSNYDTDVFSPLSEAVAEISGMKYHSAGEEKRVAMRVIADHIRTLTFAIADGAVPGNDGRGYVLRRILRRAARYGRKLDLNKPFLFELVDTLVQTMGDVFPEIKEKKEYVKKVIKGEEVNFNATLDRGIDLFEELIKGLSKDKVKVIPGEDLFMLYDTFGFPVDLTNVMSRERGFTVDEAGFNELMNSQKQRARDSAKDKFTSVNISVGDLSLFELVSKDKPLFTGYDELKSTSKIIGHKKENGNDLVILDKTPFYVEAGGQIDDLGNLTTKYVKLLVVDVTKIDDKTVHVIENESNILISTGADVIAEVDENRRWDIMRNHTATHFMHSALRKILGTHVHQAGSYVGPDRLRFDFTHFAKLSPSEVKDMESLVNEELRKNIQLQHHRNIPFEVAKKMGALMFFGDKYGDKVNVVQFGDFSLEFCGGTHVQNSSQIGLFKIISESSIASGVRRIEAVTGLGVERFIDNQIEKLKHSDDRIAELLEAKKKLEKEISELMLKEKLGQVDSILSQSSQVNGVNVYKSIVKTGNVEELKSMGDELRNKIKSGVGVLFSVIDEKVSIVCVVSDDLIKEKKLSAGKIVGEIAKLVGGGGGGKNHLATAGGKDVANIQAALSKVEEVVGKFL